MTPTRLALLLTTVGLAWLVTSRVSPRTQPLRAAVERWLPLAVATTGLGWLALRAGLQLWEPAYYGDIGAQQAMAEALALWRGLSLYPGADDPFRYASIYGPALHAFNGAALELGGGALVAPFLAAVLSTLAALALLFASLRAFVGPGPALVAAGITAAYGGALLGWKLVEPGGDALIFLLVTLSLFAAQRRTRAGALVVGACVALLALVKLPAAGYAAVAVAYLSWGRGQARRLAWVGLGGAAAGAVVLATPGFELPGYLAVSRLLASPKHLFSAMGSVRNLPPFLFLTVLPLLWLLGLVRAAQRAGDRTLLLGLGALGCSVATMLAVTMRAGAGPNHLFHLVPAGLFLAGWAARSLSSAEPAAPGRGPTVSALGVVACLAVGVLSNTASSTQATELLVSAPLLTARAIELDAIQRAFAGRELAYVMGSHGYALPDVDFANAALVRAGHPPLLCSTAVADHIRAGLPALPPATRAYMLAHRVALVVEKDNIPLGTPDLYRYYFDDGAVTPLFPAEARAFVAGAYARAGGTAHWDVYDLRPPAPAAVIDRAPARGVQPVNEVSR